MTAGLVTPREAGMGPSVLNIAASIGAKIRDAAQDAKEEREKAAEKGETPKKGSLFKSALANQFNPIKSKKAKSNWAKQFDWNKKTESDQQVKPPTGGDGDSKGKLKEFIAGGFTAILKDTGMMVSKLDGVKMMAGENLSEVTRASSTLTVIKDSIDTQTELRRKALEEAKYARAEKKLEKTSDVAGLTDAKKPEDKGDSPGSGEDGGGGPWDWIWKALGIADIAENFIPGKWLQKLNPFKKPKVTTGGAKPPGIRMPGTGPKITTSGGAPAPKVGSGFNLKNLKPGRGGLLGIGMMGAEMFMPQIQDAMSGFAGALGFGDTKLTDTELIIKILDEQARYKKLAEQNAQLPGGEYLTPSEDEYNFGNLAALKREAARRNLQIPGQKLSEGGIVPSAVPPSPVSPMAEGGIVDNPTKTTLNPGDSVIPLNRNVGKKMIGGGTKASPGETAIDTVGAMILGVSAGMLGKTESGTAGDVVKQNIRKASKEFGISNLTFTSPIGKGKFGAVDTNKDAKDFMLALFKNMDFTGLGGGKTSGGGGGDKNPPPPPPGGFGPGMTATGGSTASQYITSGFGARDTGIAGASKNHGGIDISGGPWQQGAPISVIKPGVVVEAEDLGRSGWGKYVVIKHDDGSFSLYGHLSEINVRKGDKIENKSGAARVIGKVGSTGVSSGPHLHFELGTGWNGTITGKIDPRSSVDNYVRGGGNVTVDAMQVKAANNPQQMPTGKATPLDFKEMQDGGMVMVDGHQIQVDKQGYPNKDGYFNPFGFDSGIPNPFVSDSKRRALAKQRQIARQNSPMGRAMGVLRGERLLTGGTVQDLERARGYQGGGSADPRALMRKREQQQRATQQRKNLGVYKDSSGKWRNYGVSDAATKNRWWQVWDKKGRAQRNKAAAEKQAIALAERLNKQEAAKLKPKPAPARQPSSSGGTRPASSSGGQSQSAAVVMPTVPVSKPPSAQAVGSFGSSVPAAKTSAMVFADFLYPDLV